MKPRTILIAVYLAGLAVTQLPAEEPESPSRGDVQALLDRLERAEARIRALESESQPTTATARTEAAPRPMPHSLPGDAPAIVHLEQTALEEVLEPAASDDFAQQLADLQTRQAELEKQNKDLASKLSKGLVTPGTSNASVRLAGRIHSDYWAFPGADAGADAFEGEDPQDRFIFRRVRIGVQGDIRDNMNYKIEFDFAHSSEPVFKDVYIGFTDLPVLQTVLIGNQKRPYGLDHINSSRYNIFMERPFIIEAFNQDARRLGICSYGVTEDEHWNWRYGVFHLADTQADPGYVGDHYQLEVAGRLANTYWYDESSDGRGYGHWAISGSFAEPDGDGGPQNANEARFRTRPEARTDERWLNTGRIAGAQTYELLGLEKVLNIGPLQLVGEYQNVWLQRQDGNGGDLFFWGGYAYAAYMLTGEHVPWERESGQLGRVKPFENFFFVERCGGGHGGGWGAWQVALRYSYADLSNRDILGGVGNSVTFGLNWYWNSNARLQFNYIHGYIDDHALVAGQTNARYDIVGMRAMIDY